MRILVLGCGYVGLPLARKLAGLGHEVHASRRTGFIVEGITTHQTDVTLRSSFESLPSAFDWILFTASSSRGDANVHRAVFVEGTRNLLDWLDNSPSRVLFTSSTSVYPQTNGTWVDEKSCEKPTSGAALNLALAEQLLFKSGRSCTLLRVAGIYGPERGHLYRQFLRDEAVISEAGKRWMNMIHREDVIGAILAAIEAESGIYNATDDEPVTQSVFFQWLAGRLGKSMPPTGKAVQGKRAFTNKRVNNEKLKADGWTLKYPTFRKGYEDLIREEQGEL
ncbi:MAG: NAD-dependent epimerase/dehydratase family protein [Dehalococcoidia bacterium]|nr:NAD-dependent epimerase/dehydratase family protein [Dehalococcoidia bacterium]